jgi:hypothetical protein
MDDNIGTGGTAGWPTPFIKSGRILETEETSHSAQMPGSASLSIILPSGGIWVLNGRVITLDSDQVIGPISPNFEGYIVPTVNYDEETETLTWDHEEYAVRPTLGSGVAAKVTTVSDRVTEIDVTEASADVIPTLPLLLERIRSVVSGEGGSSITYLSELKYSIEDPRSATVVVEEKIDAVLAQCKDLIEAGADRSDLSDMDQLWLTVIGMSRAIAELAPNMMRFLNLGMARPGIYGTESAPSTENFDRGGTLPEDDEERNYHA